MRRVAATLILLALASCCDPEACDPEKLPHRGHATTPAELAEIAQYEARNECWSSLYDLLSRRTQAKYSRFDVWAGFPHIHMPPPDDDCLVRDVIVEGTFLNARVNPADPTEALAYFRYRDRRFQILILGEDGEWRIALVDQVEDGKYPILLGR